MCWGREGNLGGGDVEKFNTGFSGVGVEIGTPPPPDRIETTGCSLCSVKSSGESSASPHPWSVLNRGEEETLRQSREGAGRAEPNTDL